MSQLMTLHFFKTVNKQCVKRAKRQPWLPLAFLIFSSPLKNVFLAMKFVSVVFYLSLLSTSVYTLKFNRKKTRLCCCLLSASYRQNERVLQMRNFTPTYVKGWTYVRTILSEPKFLGCIDNQIILPTVLRWAIAPL